MTATAFPSTIDLQHVQSLGNVDEALRSFFDDAVAAASAETGVSQRAIRDWVDAELISEQGFRTQALRGPGGSGAAVLVALENGHVIRTDSRRGAQWYELCHDRLVAPVRESNAAWRAANLAAFQLDAMAWDHQGHPEVMLMSGEPLAAAVDWATANQQALLPIDQEFLDASIAQEHQQLSGLRASRRARVLLWAAIGLAVLALVGGSIAVSRSRESNDLRTARRAADANAAEARSQALLADASAAEAEKQQRRAEQSAAEANKQQLLAEQSADQARSQQLLAAASEAEAQQQQQRAELLAEEADRQKRLAEANAADAAEQQALAEASEAEAQKQQRRAEVNAAEAQRQQRLAESSAAEAEALRQLAEQSAADARAAAQRAQDLQAIAKTRAECVTALALKQSNETGALILRLLDSGDIELLREKANFMKGSIFAIYDPHIICR